MYTILSKAIIVDLVLYRVASVEEIKEVHQKEKELGLPILWVDKMSAYNNYNNILQSIMVGEDVDAHRIEYFIGREPSPEEIDAIAIVGKMRSIVTNMLHKPKPDYTFVKVPNGSSLEQALSMKKTTIYNRSGYQMGYKTARNVWDYAYPRWAQFDNGEHVDKKEFWVKASGYTRRVIITKNAIEIGCQTVPRWVLEQLAIKQGWV